MPKKPPIDEHLNAVLICAVRYCIGRQFYMPGLVQEWIMHHVVSGKRKNEIDVSTAVMGVCADWFQGDVWRQKLVGGNP